MAEFLPHVAERFCPQCGEAVERNSMDRKGDRRGQTRNISLDYVTEEEKEDAECTALRKYHIYVCSPYRPKIMSTELAKRELETT